MLLVIDIGNTNTVVGIYRDEDLMANWRLVSSHTRTADEYWIMVRQLCDSAGVSTTKITGIAISSVVPDLTKSFTKMSCTHFNVEPVVITNDLKLNLELKVREPKQLGADRLCNIVAAKELYRLPLIVIDLGTATTFDVLNGAGHYIGGAISPGLVTGALELIRKAAQLHDIDLMYPDSIIGKTTREHMQGGIFVGHIAMIEGLVERIRKELGGDDIFVVATGGYSDEVSHNTDSIDTFNKNLTLEGLKKIYKLNKKGEIQ